MIPDQLTQARAEEAVRRTIEIANISREDGRFGLRVSIITQDLIATDWRPKPEVDWATRVTREWYADMDPSSVTATMAGSYDAGPAFQALRARILALGEPVTADQVEDGEEVLVTYKTDDIRGWQPNIHSIRRLPKQEGE